MRSRVVWSIFWAIVASIGIAGCTGHAPSSTKEPSPAVTLARQAEEWDRAIVRKDRVAVEANMADDFRGIDGAGVVEDKRAFVDGLMSPALTIHPYTVDDFEIRIYDNVALLSGRTRMTGTFEGKPFTSHYRYIDVYVRFAERWKVVSVQITRLAE